MRVVHVVPGLAEEASGPTYSVTRLCGALIDAGQVVTLAAVDFGARQEPPPFVKTFPLGVGPRRLGSSPKLYGWLRQQCVQGQARVVHNHGMWQMNALYPAWAARGTKTILLQSPRDAFSEWSMRWGSKAKPAFWHLLQKPALHRITCFHATAESEYNDIRRLGFRQPVTVIPNGIHVPELPVRRSGSGRTLLFLGRIHPQKGLDLLIRAWKGVEQEFPDWRLVIAGPDNAGHLPKMQALAEELRAGRIIFAGPVYGDEKTASYRDADLFVLPTYSENFGMSVAEALAVGTPVLVTKGAPWSGVIPERAGWWVDVDHHALTAGLRDAMGRSATELQEMGARGRSWMMRSFGWSGIGERMAKTYEWLVNRSLPIPEWVHLD